jgi:hypothetical protein
MTPNAGEPDYDPAEPENWVHWAREELAHRAQRVADAIVEPTRLRRQLAEMQEQLNSYKTIFEKEQRLRITEPGGSVYIGPDGTTKADVLEVRIYLGHSVVYRVGWWEKDRWREATLPASQVNEDAPMPQCPVIHSALP